MELRIKLTNKHSVLLSLCCLSLFLVSGCAPSPAIKANYKSSSEQINFNLIDERPINQKKSFTEADSVGQNLHIGDDRMNPGAYDLVKTALHENLQKSLTGKTVVLSDFIIIITDPAFTLDQRGMDLANEPIQGVYIAEPVTSAVIYGIEKLKGRRNVYVRITGNINGKTFSNQNSEDFYFGVSEKNLFKLINKTIADTVTEARTLTIPN